jgi:hypothetical protein
MPRDTAANDEFGPHARATLGTTPLCEVRWAAVIGEAVAARGRAWEAAGPKGLENLYIPPKKRESLSPDQLPRRRSLSL